MNVKHDANWMAIKLEASSPVQGYVESVDVCDFQEIVPVGWSIEDKRRMSESLQQRERHGSSAYVM